MPVNPSHPGLPGAQSLSLRLVAVAGLRAPPPPPPPPHRPCARGQRAWRGRAPLTCCLFSGTTVLCCLCTNVWNCVPSISDNARVMYDKGRIIWEVHSQGPKRSSSRGYFPGRQSCKRRVCVAKTQHHLGIGQRLTPEGVPPVGRGLPFTLSHGPTHADSSQRSGPAACSVGFP